LLHVSKPWMRKVEQTNNQGLPIKQLLAI